MMRRTPMADGRVTLFCLPYAGGGATIYHGWKSRIPSWIELMPLHLPGRGVRHNQPAMHDWRELIGLLLRDVQPYIARPLAIFGHSMGALIGLELAYAIRARHQRTPVWFGASGSKAPSRRELDLKWLDCPEETLVDELRSLNGTPPELLDNRELLQLVLPVVRADFHLCGSYCRPRRAPLDCPLLVLAGMDDQEVSQPHENLTAWHAETSGACQVEMLDGDHFFIEKRQDAVISLVVESLSKAVINTEPRV
jgi:surfactin synthase thioesterase subunit